MVPTAMRAAVGLKRFIASPPGLLRHLLGIAHTAMPPLACAGAVHDLR